MLTLTSADAVSDPVIPWTGGRGTVAALGTWGGGSLAIEASFDGANWLPVADTAGDVIALTADGLVSIEIAACQLRANLSGSFGATVFYTIAPIP